MASIRTDERRDGTAAYRVNFRHNGKQTCLTFGDAALANVLCNAINQLGAARALELPRIDRTPRRDTTSSLTVEQWLTTYIAA